MQQNRSRTELSRILYFRTELSRILYLLHKGLSPLSTNNKSIPYIYLDDTITMAVIITARNSLHTILNFQFFFRTPTTKSTELAQKVKNQLAGLKTNIP